MPAASATLADRAAASLLDARARRRPLAALPEDARPRSAEDAYAIQDRVVAAIGPIGGWKVGAKSPDAEPSCAPLCAAWLRASPARFAAGSFLLNGIEGELAFTLAHDLPPRGEPYAREDVIAAVATVHPAIEIVDSRFAAHDAVDLLSQLADCGLHGALVVGAGIALPAGFSVTDQTVELDIAGARAFAGRDSNTAGDPFRLLAWLANHAAVRCGGLRRGEAITTGAWTGLRFARPGDRVRAGFAGIGEAGLSLE
jgi:2-keto-4-pentenoate hydratase